MTCMFRCQYSTDSSVQQQSFKERQQLKPCLTCKNTHANSAQMQVACNKDKDRNAAFALTFFGALHVWRFLHNFLTPIWRARSNEPQHQRTKQWTSTSQSHCIYAFITMTEDVHTSNFVTYKLKTPRKFDITKTTRYKTHGTSKTRRWNVLTLSRPTILN